MTKIRCEYCRKLFDMCLEPVPNKAFCPYCGRKFTPCEDKERANIRIEISGTRACGKTTLALYLKHLFLKHGAKVDMIGCDFDGFGGRLTEVCKENKKIDLDKMHITIKEMLSSLDGLPSSVDIARRNLEIYNTDKK